MDPTATWQRIIDALRENDTLEAIDAAIDLGGWLNGGGFMPAFIDTVHVWSILHFLMKLDPDDAMRNANDESDADDQNGHGYERTNSFRKPIVTAGLPECD